MPPSTCGEDDHLSPYPRAPPPSPELQQRNYFDDLLKALSPSKFNTPRKCELSPSNSLDFSTMFTSPRSPGPVISEPDSPTSTHALDNHSLEECSPRHSLEYSNSHSNSPPGNELSNLHIEPEHSSPQQVCPRLSNGFGNSHVSTTPQPLSPPNHFISHSYSETRSVHPHLPLSFETAQVSDQSLRRRAPSFGCVDDPGHRKRKISLKRKNDDLDIDTNLQFSFDYSYSSSSGDSDSWVLVEPSSLPLGKKACQDNQMTRERASSFGSSLMNTPRRGSNASHQQVDPRGHAGGFHHHSAPIMGSVTEHQTRTPSLGNLGGPLSSIASIDSIQMMDCGDSLTSGRMDSLDSMDTGEPTNTEMDSLTQLCVNESAAALQNQLPQIVTTVVPSYPSPNRSHSSGEAYSSFNPHTDSKHSLMQHYFSSYHEQHGEHFLGTGGNNSAKFNFNFSKSL